jgi:uncharacterized protein (DUF305 family)
MRRAIFAFVASLAVGAILVAAGCGGDPSSSGASSTRSVPFDRAFIDAMVPHHQQAIEMAQDAKAAGISEPVLMDIATAIIATQEQEIDQMESWREKWFGSREIDPDGADALGMSMDEMGMSEDRMDFEMESDVDAAFASMMVDHHQGAIKMTKLALERTTHEEIKTLAEEIIATQQDEIDLMSKFADSGGHDMGEMGG